MTPTDPPPLTPTPIIVTGGFFAGCASVMLFLFGGFLLLGATILYGGSWLQTEENTRYAENGTRVPGTLHTVERHQETRCYSTATDQRSRARRQECKEHITYVASYSYKDKAGILHQGITQDLSGPNYTLLHSKPPIEVEYLESDTTVSRIHGLTSPQKPHTLKLVSYGLGSIGGLMLCIGLLAIRRSKSPHAAAPRPQPPQGPVLPL